MRSPTDRVLRAALLVLSLAAALPAGAVRAPEPGTLLPDFDRRIARNARYQAAVALQNGAKPSQLLAGPVADPGPVRRAALAELSKSAGLIEVRWDEITGSPRLLFARQGFLTPPDPRPAESIARSFLATHRALFLLDEDQVKALSLKRSIPTSAGGAVLRFQQSHGGLEILHGQVAVAVTADGRITHVMGGQVSGLAAGGSTIPKSNPSQALQVLAAMAGVELVKAPVPVAVDDVGATFQLEEFRGTVRVQREMFATAGGSRLGWSADLFVAGSPAGYALLVDDASLEPVRRATRTWFLDTRGRAFFNNPADSVHDLYRFVDSEDYRFDVSPAGWTDEAIDPRVSSGNNAIVQDDIANDDEASPGQQAAASGPAPYWSFDHPFTDGGAGDAQSSLTNLFWAINTTHDRMHALGFDEPSGNFQQDNFGRGGLGGDPVFGDDMDGSGTNNANFQTPPDGFPGRMQMYLWDGSGTPRSSSFETGIVIHEFVHGVSTRLVGGPDDADCLFGWQSGSMGEAWSDYFAGSMLDDTIIAAWVSGDPAGIRMFALDDNPPTGKDYRNFCQYGNDQQPQFCEVHDNGEMWSGLLWMIRELYVATYGATEGVARADQLIMDAMKYTPCAPSMLDARDALVLADRMQTGGQMECAIKGIAASRWMGFNATSTGGADSEPVAGDREWPECIDRGVVRFDREGLEAGAARATYGCDDQVVVTLTDGNYTETPDSIVVSVLRAAVEVDRELLSPFAGDGPGTFSAAIRTSTLPGFPGDGQLQVQAGDVLEASYVDLDPGGSIATTQADVQCAARLRIVRHRIVNGSCDADEVAGYPQLPGFVDAGETADIEVELANLAPLALDGLVHVLSDNPNLTVLPAGPIPVSFAPAIGTSPSTIVLRLRGIGSPAIVAGETANLSFTFEAPTVPRDIVATLALEMGLDYEVQAGLSRTFDVEGETAPVGPEWTRGELGPATGNQWTVVTCQNTTPGGTKAFRNGPANCAGRYTDAQGNPYLSSPPLDLFAADTRAARITQAEWQNKINLGVAGFPPTVPLAIDADAVVVVLTNDPTQLDISDPITVATSALAFYIRVDIPDFYQQNSNTTTFVLDQRPIAPGQFQGVDLAAPTFLTWYFLPDITFVQPPLDAQGEGYYLDDIRVEYERVRAIPQAATCTPVASPYAVAFVADPPFGAACAGELATIDASRSEVALCGPPADLEYRFLVGGAPVACFEGDGVTPRAQDVDGWGIDPTCTEAVLGDTTYAVEVRCAASPAETDAAVASVRVLDGLAVLSGSERAFCVGSGATIVVDGAASSLVGCPGEAEYLFSDPNGPLDCDGDGLPDAHSTLSTCEIGPSDDPLEITLDIRCSALPGCSIQSTTAIPAVSATADIAEATTPPGGFYCSGATASLDAGRSVVTGCDDGQVQYRWTSTGGFDSGWATASTLDVTVTADDAFSVEARCTLSPACSSAPAGPLSVQVRTGEFSFSHSAQPDDCVGELFQLVGGVRNPPGVRCAGAVEYRFTQQVAGPALVPVTCWLDAAGTTPRPQDVDGWGTDAGCYTPHLSGGADFVIEYRCSDDPSCLLETSLPRTITPRDGAPAGTTEGVLRVRKSAAGCVAGSDVRLSWPDSDYVPAAFLVFRSDDPLIDTTAERLGPVDDITYTDAGVGCDGGGVPYRGVAVYFYVHSGRDQCTGEPLP